MSVFLSGRGTKGILEWESKSDESERENGIDIIWEKTQKIDDNIGTITLIFEKLVLTNTKQHQFL